MIGDRYVEVPAETLFAFLAAKGFERTVRFREVVFARKHHADPRYEVLVYTSVRDGATSARGRGADAIRVCAVYNHSGRPGEGRGVAKLPKVLRTGSVEAVLERVLGRMREAYGVCGKRIAHRRLPGETRSAPTQEADLRDEDAETETYRVVHGEDGR